MKKEGAIVILSVEDDGAGFDKSKIGKVKIGIGLGNINTRVKLIGGDFIIKSSLGKGTRAEVLVQLKWGRNPRNTH